MNQRERCAASIVKRALAFDRAWTNRSLADGPVYDAAMSLVRAVRTYRDRALSVEAPAAPLSRRHGGGK